MEDSVLIMETKVKCSQYLSYNGNKHRTSHRPGTSLKKNPTHPLAQKQKYFYFGL